MTVARAAQDEVEAVRREMQEKVKAAQETADRQVRVKFPLCFSNQTCRCGSDSAFLQGCAWFVSGV